MFGICRFSFLLGGVVLLVAAGCKFDTAGISAGGNPNPVCGNGIMEPGEVCDGDDTGALTCADLAGYVGGTLRCSADCQSYNRDDCIPEGDCGNGNIDPPEECDGANLNGQSCESLNLGQGTLLCNTDCTFDMTGCSIQPVCGNSTVEGTEACDDGNQDNDDACLNNCRNASCGDGYVWSGQEECDDGNNVSGDGCSAACLVETPVDCGNGQLDLNESCDDGNTANNDGCSAACQIETGWQCTGEPSVCVTVCNDGFVRGTEECDDGNNTAGDGCSDDCKVEPFHACAEEPSVCVCVVFVDIDSSSAQKSGDSWANAFNRVQQGIDTAASLSGTCEVWVAEGTYLLYQGGPENSLLLAGGVELYGGFNATENARDQRDWSAHQTILNGQSQITPANRVNHVVTANQITGAVLDGFVIVGGQTGPSDSGGGMRIDGGSVTVANCVFRQNSADYDGGGLVAYNSDSTVVGCAFDRNTATYGGGVLVEGGNTTVQDCLFEGNSASNEGGGLFFYNTSSTALNCQFLGNAAAAGNGGGLNMRFGSPVVEACFFDGNQASRGGGMLTNQTDATVTRCWFQNNTTTSTGGGLCNDNSTATVENSVFWNNTSPYGGGIQNRAGAAPLVVNCTFYQNRSSSAEGHAVRTFDSNATLVNIIARGTATGEIAHAGTGSTSVTYSHIEGGYTGTGNSSDDPQFVNAANGDFHLQPVSTAIDSADGDSAPLEDFDGNPRVDHPSQPNNGTGSPNYADRGAFETQ